MELFLAGETLTDEAKKKLYKSAEEYGITRSQIIFHEDATSIPQEFSEVEIVKGIFEQTDKQIQRLNDSIAKLGQQLTEYKEKEMPVEAVSKELFAQYSNITSLSLSRGSSVAVEGEGETEQIVAFVTSNEPLTDDQKDRIERWLKARLNNDNVMLVCQLAEKEIDAD